MSLLFTPIQIKTMEVNNRFVHSATYECMANETGEVTDDLTKRYRTLAKGEIGLIIPGHMYVHPLGRAMKNQTGIHTNEMIPGLKKLAEAVHEEGGKIAFQLAHAGLQTEKAVTGQSPLAPSGKVRNPATFQKPKEMSEAQIQETIEAFAKAAERAAEAGADAVQFHGAHGFLIDEFLSPFFNQRKDQWGGSDENRFRFLKEVFLAVKRTLPDGMPVLVKLNTNDFTPKTGITPELANRYAGWLAELGIDAVELSCGTYFTWHVIRGEIPINESAKAFPMWMRPLLKLNFKKQAATCRLEEGYNLEAAKVVKPALKRIPLMLVGGMRRISQLDEILDNNYADLISMSRPFIREPLLVKRLKEGKTQEAACVSCNKCFVAVVFHRLPIRCYHEGIPA